jgi:hypothetical protein
MSININTKNDVKPSISTAAEQWLNLVLAHIEHKRQVKKHSKNKNKHAK